MLLCGITTQTHSPVADWDEVIQPGDLDFLASSLRAASVIRLSYLRSALPTEVQRVIGSIDPARLARLLTHLADHVRP